jgi:hypothetical protein
LGVYALVSAKAEYFDNYTADDRTISFVFTTVLGGCLAYFAPKISLQSKSFLFMNLSISYVLFDFWLYAREWLIYLLTVWMDKWESAYRSARKQYASKSGERLSPVK